MAFTVRNNAKPIECVYVLCACAHRTGSSHILMAAEFFKHGLQPVWTAAHDANYFFAACFSQAFIDVDVITLCRQNSFVWT